jgi:hypothetical protein
MDSQSSSMAHWYLCSSLNLSAPSVAKVHTRGTQLFPQLKRQKQQKQQQHRLCTSFSFTPLFQFCFMCTAAKERFAMLLGTP